MLHTNSLMKSLTVRIHYKWRHELQLDCSVEAYNPQVLILTSMQWNMMNMNEHHFLFSYFDHILFQFSPTCFCAGCFVFEFKCGFIYTAQRATVAKNVRANKHAANIVRCRERNTTVYRIEESGQRARWVEGDREVRLGGSCLCVSLQCRPIAASLKLSA